MRLAAALAAVVPLAAQTPAIVHILAEESQVLVGRSVQLRAVVRDAAGNAIPNAPVTWTANQPQAGSISGSGEFTARGLATFRITARSGAAVGEAALQSIPSRVDVAPGSMELLVGAQHRFTAAAYDANGAVIPGVTFAWSLTNQRQGGSSLGRVDTTGLVTATGEGGVWVWATYTYNETFPGLQRQWVAYSKVRIDVPKMYELNKLYSTLGKTRKSWTLRPRQSMLWSTDDGQLFLNASLGGLANGLLNWDQDRWRLVTGGGIPRFGRGAVALEFLTHAIARNGEMVTYESTNGNGVELFRGNRNGLRVFLNNNVPLAETEANNDLRVNRNSYTSSGWTTVRANFRFENTTVNHVGVFRGSRGQMSELLIGTHDALPGFASPITIDVDFGIADNGTAFYSATSGTMRAFFRHGFSGRERLLAVGDELEGSTVARFIGGRGNSLSWWFDEDGTAILCVQLQDNSQYYVRIKPSGARETMRWTGQSGILWHHPAHGTLLYVNPFNNRGNGVYLWDNAGALKQVLASGVRLFDQTIQEIESGTINKSGEITLLLRGSLNALMAARMGESPYVLFAAGNEIPVELPVNAFTFVGGARTGPPHIQAGGNSGSIATFWNGDFHLTLGIGERLFGTTMWFGGSHGNAGLFNMRKSANGDIYFTNGAGIGRIRTGGEPELALAFPLRPDASTTVNAPGQINVNARGDLLFQSSTNLGDNRIFIHKDGQTRQILVLSATANTATVIEGRTVQSLDSFAMDDQNRVLAQLRFRDLAVPVIGYYDGLRWSLAAMPNQTRVGPHVITNLPNFPRADGNRLFTGFTISTGGVVVGEWNGSGWDMVVNNSTTMPNGQVANNVPLMELNARGDLLFQFANGVTSLVVRRGNEFHQVHNFFRPTPQGDYLIRITSMDFRDDGTVYFLAVTEEDEVVLYEARPLF